MFLRFPLFSPRWATFPNKETQESDKVAAGESGLGAGINQVRRRLALHAAAGVMLAAVAYAADVTVSAGSLVVPLAVLPVLYAVCAALVALSPGIVGSSAKA
jgi:hypothetical protein